MVSKLQYGNVSHVLHTGTVHMQYFCLDSVYSAGTYIPVRYVIAKITVKAIHCFIRTRRNNSTLLLLQNVYNTHHGPAKELQVLTASVFSKFVQLPSVLP